MVQLPCSNRSVGLLRRGRPPGRPGGTSKTQHMLWANSYPLLDLSHTLLLFILTEAQVRDTVAVKTMPLRPDDETFCPSRTL